MFYLPTPLAEKYLFENQFASGARGVDFSFLGGFHHRKASLFDYICGRIGFDCGRIGFAFNLKFTNTGGSFK